MIHQANDEDLEQVQLDDYNDDDYFFDDDDHKATTSNTANSTELSDQAQDTTETMKSEAEDDAQKQCRKFKNARRAEQRQRVTQQHQRRYQSTNHSYFPTTELRNIINISRDAHNIIISRQQETAEVEAYSPTNYHIPQDYLRSTRKHKQATHEAEMEHPAQGKQSYTLQERFEKALHSFCPWHPNENHSAFVCRNLRKALGAPPLNGIKGNNLQKRR